RTSTRTCQPRHPEPTLLIEESILGWIASGLSLGGYPWYIRNLLRRSNGTSLLGWLVWLVEEDVSIFVELESGGPPPEACRVVGVGQPPSRTDEEGGRREQQLPEEGRRHEPHARDAGAGAGVVWADRRGSEGRAACPPAPRPPP